MTERRGLRIGEILVGVALAAGALKVVKEPRTFANPMDLPHILAQPWSKGDPTYLLCAAGVSGAAVVLLLVALASRFATGRTRVALAGAAVGGWAYYFLALAPNVDSGLRFAWTPERLVAEATQSFTPWLMGLPRRSCLFLG